MKDFESLTVLSILWLTLSGLNVSETVENIH